VSWCRKASDQGFAQAQFNLGFMLADGLGAPQDCAAAVGWYLKAAKQGLSDAQDKLGLMYEEGWGVPQDFAMAEIWYRKAAGGGFVGAEAKAQQVKQREQEHQGNEKTHRPHAQRERDSGARSNNENPPDWWTILGIEPGASLERAKHAYRMKMKHYHPDRLAGLGPEFVQLAEQRSRELNEAMEKAEL
jgi:TPR repeat protein